MPKLRLNSLEKISLLRYEKGLGSPIIQDGKLVGAVTPVLVNDPIKGYGIFIENMLDAAS